ncbi:MAG: hypothetical protein COA78_05020 [Blastopirellula sp.]|nr:MAG: hypothetical protein COA78_05020 [Blastopirellula sp.]
MPKRVYSKAYASIRFNGPQLDPLIVTQALKLPPDHQHRNGEPRLVRTRSGKIEENPAYRQGQWSMSSKDLVESPKLETHIRWLLSQLEPLALEIQGFISRDIKVDFFCYSVGSIEQPPSLSNEIKERARLLGIEIVIDHYYEASASGEMSS